MAENAPRESVKNYQPDEPDENGVPSGQPMKDQDEKSSHHDDFMSLTSEFINSVEELIDREDQNGVRELCLSLRPADIADLIEQLPESRRAPFIYALGDDLSPEVFAELEEGFHDLAIETLPRAKLAEVVSELDTDEAAHLVQSMDVEEREELFADIQVADRLAITAALEYPEDSAGRIMQRDVFAVPSFSTVGQIIDRLRSPEIVPDLFYEVFVVDPAFKVLGSVQLSRFLRAPRETAIVELIKDEILRVRADQDQEEIAYLFEKYNLISAPVIDDGERLVGMITVDDIVEVIHEEADEDMLALAGVSEDSSLSLPVPKIARSRFAWLAVNLGTAILASLVISLFDATIEQVVALAILMPIVASMGGNAGTQTLTVAVRNLATRDLTAANALRVVGRETAVSLINGAAFAILLGVSAGVWYSFIGDGVGDGIILGSVLAAAMIITMLAAGLSGILVPIGLQRMGADPAVSSAVFVTTVTDIVGFFAFLGLAAIFLVG